MPLKFGHNDDQPITDGMPALGWVERIWREGENLMADFRDVPAVVMAAIKRGLYKFTSVELLRKVKAKLASEEEREYPFVLDAVALLGADPPAVSGLSDLQALTYARESDLISSFERIEFSSNTSPRREDHTRMDELEKLRKQLDDEREKARKLEAEKVELTRSKDELEASNAKAKAEATRGRVNGLLDTAVSDNRMTPAMREQFVALHRLADDDAIETLNVEGIEKYLKELPKIDLSRDPTSRKKVEGKGDDDDISYEDADVLLSREVMEIQAERDIDFAQASKLALMRKPELARKWMFRMDHVETKAEG